MTREQAQEILLLSRGGGDGESDPEMAEALRLAEADVELGRWLEQHRQFQSDVRKEFASIEPPTGLKDRILAGAKTAQKPESFLRRNQIWAVAASIVVLFALSDFWLGRDREDRSFGNFRSRMTSFAVRSYQMDIVTNSEPAVRQYLVSHGAPADFKLTAGLEKLAVKGGGRLSWHNQPVSMMCFSLTNNQTAFMFVMDRTAVEKEAPTFEVSGGRSLTSVAWSEDGKVYLLAAAEKADVLSSLAPR
jgi:hypothetical protein